MTTLPGCFSSIITYSDKDDYCKECHLFADCGQATQQRLEMLREKLSVKAEQQRSESTGKPESKKAVNYVNPKSAPVTITMTESQVELSDESKPPKKARQLLGQIFRKGMTVESIRAALFNGENPFVDTAPVKMKLTCDLLLDRGFSRSDLRNTLMTVGMSDGTAKAQVSLISAALNLAGLVEEVNGVFKIRSDNE